jgi:hypothetical protein
MTAEANPQPNAPPSPGGSDAGPWHDGERAIHRRLGLDETIDPIGRRNIRPFMPDQHRLFFAQLPFAFLGALDRAGSSQPHPLSTERAPPPESRTSPYGVRMHPDRSAWSSQKGFACKTGGKPS